ncbi:hypothetical protein A0J61_08616 [Choanephora cucurbitarum]|uniref:Uncharacterized protein n=1 Tax=Choanephora cucurbitarum TaxID=101091 RepID=A0A1C7N2Q3_9FUNG|nr:hypothetical protein A0J61_08616 [Choanephora cucurbitarum]
MATLPSIIGKIHSFEPAAVQLGILATQAQSTKPSKPSTPSKEFDADLCRSTQSGQQRHPVNIFSTLQKKASVEIRKEISQLIQLLNEQRYKSYLTAKECMRNLSNQRFSLYIRRRASTMSTKDKGKQKAEKTLRYIQRAGVNKQDTVFNSEDSSLSLDPQ